MRGNSIRAIFSSVSSSSFEVCRASSSSCPGENLYNIGDKGNAEMVFRGTEPLKFTRHCHFFFSISGNLRTRNETSVAYDDTNDINTGEGNCFALSRHRSKCASSCNRDARDARGEVFSRKDYRCVRFRLR